MNDRQGLTQLIPPCHPPTAVYPALDIHLHGVQYICMRTTLNLPDLLARDAKQKALEEGKTLTELIVDGLRIRLSRAIPARTLPISTATGGLLPGVDWMRLEVEEPAMDIYR